MEYTAVCEMILTSICTFPSRLSLGSQKFLCIRCGARRNQSGGYGLPLSKRQTRRTASASQYAVTEPPNPEPTITASKCASSNSNSDQYFVWGVCDNHPLEADMSPPWSSLMVSWSFVLMGSRTERLSAPQDCSNSLPCWERPAHT
jgi:hypothetical protein